MKHHKHTPEYSKTYSVAVLIKESTFKQKEIEEKYIIPLVAEGIPIQDIITYSLKYNAQGKAPAALIKAYLTALLKAVKSNGVTTLLVADSAYFKVLTKVRKVEPHHGYVLPCKIDGFEDMRVIISVNYAALFYDPKLQTKLDMSIKTLADHVTGFHINLGSGVIHSEYYPDNLQDIQHALTKLYQYAAITCDIEAFSLRFEKAGIGTIAFAWDQHNGIAFAVDYNNQASSQYSHRVRAMLRFFFTHYEGKVIYHGATYDIKVFIYTLFMKTPLNNEGILEGLEIFYRNMDDTKIITYLAVNSTTRNNLGLKHTAFEYLGNWAEEEIKDIRKIPLPELLTYNLKDALGTWYTRNKNYPIMVKDNQEKLYKELFRPSLKVITQMELTGMPLNRTTVNKVKKELDDIQWDLFHKLNDSPFIIEFEDQLRKEAMIEKNLLLKRLVKTLHSFVHIYYNPASNKQTARLLYDYFGFEIEDTTDTGLPAVGAKTIKKLLNKLKQEYSITDEELR